MNSGSIEITSVRRSSGALRRVAVSSGKVYLVLKGPDTERFLEEGTPLDPGDIEELEGPVAREAGMSFSLRYLSRRERTEHELRCALSSEGIDNPASIDYIVETLRGRNLINDRRFASELIEYRMKHRPAGPALLRRKLGEAGVAAEITDELLGQAFPAGREREIALELAIGRLKRGRGTGGGRTGGAGRGDSAGRDARSERERAARRLNGFLSRRGFSAGITGDICAAVLRGEITGETDEQ